MKLIRGTVIGGIVIFLLGYLVWGILLMDFTMNNYNQSIYLPTDKMILWAMIASNLFMALMQTLFLKWGQAKTWIDGLKIGALFGVLYALSLDLGFYGMTNVILNFGAIIVDTLAYIIVCGLTGLVIVLTWGKKD